LLERRDVPVIYALTDPAQGSHARIARTLFDCGVRWVQIRDKQTADSALYDEVRSVLNDAPAGATVFVNDRADIALAAGAHGVHLGEEDLPPSMARMAAQNRPLIIGYSTHSLQELMVAADDPAVDYLAIGPIFVSPTKNVRAPLGVDAIREVRAVTGKPIVAIGGIDAANIGAVLAAGADSVAVISAVYRRGAIAENIGALLTAAGAGR
jgi:thiamine-phosphate pyrophosphorylase